MEDLNIVDVPKPPISPISHIPLISLIILLFLSLSLSAYLGYQNLQLKKKFAYDNCVKSEGSRTQKSYPGVCTTVNGQKFTEPLGFQTTTTATPTPTNQNKIFCGGFAGMICPSGYTCQYTNNYPDASGTCEKEQQRGEGVLKATVIRSPTCPGGVTEKDPCEGPAENETFYIIKLTGVELSERKTVTTDKNGQFSITLGPGTYKLQNSESGVGKEISSPNFTIAAGNTTAQTFNIDTGIR